MEILISDRAGWPTAEVLRLSARHLCGLAFRSVCFYLTLDFALPAYNWPGLPLPPVITSYLVVALFVAVELSVIQRSVHCRFALDPETDWKFGVYLTDAFLFTLAGMSILGFLPKIGIILGVLSLSLYLGVYLPSTFTAIILAWINTKSTHKQIASPGIFAALCKGGVLTPLNFIPLLTAYTSAVALIFAVVSTKTQSPMSQASYPNSEIPSGGLSTRYKPVIYLYPPAPQEIEVKLCYPSGRLTFTHPQYDESIEGWRVKVAPDGTLTDLRDGKEYSYLFWEGESKTHPNYDLRKGFVVRGQDIRTFLQDILPKFGLTAREYNEFIVFWYPRLSKNKYNHIYFAGAEYDASAPLSISPRPDSILRVFMVARAIDRPIEVIAQEIAPFERKGFSVIEWGGEELE